MSSVSSLPGALFAEWVDRELFGLGETGELPPLHRESPLGRIQSLLLGGHAGEIGQVPAPRPSLLRAATTERKHQKDEEEDQSSPPIRFESPPHRFPP